MPFESELVRLGKMVVRLSKQYARHERSEGTIHDILFGELEATFGNITREYPAERGWGRIDFRYGSSNPRVIELVVRDPQHRIQHYGTQNKSELNKLCRVPYTKARGRILLILDASGLNPIPKDRLKATYDGVRSTRGRYQRHQVTVMYVHPGHQYRFMWRP